MLVIIIIIIIIIIITQSRVNQKQITPGIIYKQTLFNEGPL